MRIAQTKQGVRSEQVTLCSQQQQAVSGNKCLGAQVGAARTRHCHRRVYTNLTYALTWLREGFSRMARSGRIPYEACREELYPVLQRIHRSCCSALFSSFPNRRKRIQLRHLDLLSKRQDSHAARRLHTTVVVIPIQPSNRMIHPTGCWNSIWRWRHFTGRFRISWIDVTGREYPPL